MSVKKQQKVLIAFSKILKNHNIKYALGGSLLLYYKGMNPTVDDIDILVPLSDHEKLKSFLNNYKFKYIQPNNIYKTTHFYSITVDEIDIDIMLGFKVQTKTGLYEFPFRVESTITIDNHRIMLSSVDEWLLAYTAMNRTDKVSMIIEHKKKCLN